LRPASPVAGGRFAAIFASGGDSSSKKKDGRKRPGDWMSDRCVMTGGGSARIMVRLLIAVERIGAMA
jgi:hypothetical protein